jgi:5-(carboxyamino)imidazole ribonucleotide synthase
VKIGIIGAGQLGRMLALAGYPLAQQFRFLDTSADAPGGQVAPIITGAFDDPHSLERLAADVDPSRHCASRRIACSRSCCSRS